MTVMLALHELTLSNDRALRCGYRAPLSKPDKRARRLIHGPDGIGEVRRGDDLTALFLSLVRGADVTDARGVRAFGVEQQDHAAFAHLVADLDLDLAHDPGGGRRDVHGRLVGFERHERILGGDDSARKEVYVLAREYVVMLREHIWIENHYFRSPAAQALTPDEDAKLTQAILLCRNGGVAERQHFLDLAERHRQLVASW